MTGVIVFDISTGKPLASTFSQDYVKKTVKIEQLIAQLEKNRILKLDPCGPKNWSMHSFGKKL